MTELTTVDGENPFDSIKMIRPDGEEYWSARDIMPLMGYGRWQTFEVPLNRAMKSAANTGMDVTSNFTRSRTFSGTKPADDFQLSRHAAYLVAMNGDPNKEQVAAAQAYFAARTVQAERAGLQATGLPGWAVALHALVDQQAAIEVEQRRQASVLHEVAARVESIEGSHGWFSALAYAITNGLPTERGYLQRVGVRAGRVLREDGQVPGKTQHPAYGTVNTYPAWALERGFAEMPEAS